jgi:hypothetical protein
VRSRPTRNIADKETCFGIALDDELEHPHENPPLFPLQTVRPRPAFLRVGASALNAVLGFGLMVEHTVDAQGSLTFLRLPLNVRLLP